MLKFKVGSDLRYQTFCSRFKEEMCGSFRSIWSGVTKHLASHQILPEMSWYISLELKLYSQSILTLSWPHQKVLPAPGIPSNPGRDVMESESGFYLNIQLSGVWPGWCRGSSPSKRRGACDQPEGRPGDQVGGEEYLPCIYGHAGRGCWWWWSWWWCLWPASVWRLGDPMGGEHIYL